MPELTNPRRPFLAGEALRNALRRSGARPVYVEIGYDREHLRLCVRDDGKGRDAQAPGPQARGGHFGIVRMRECTALDGGKLTVWSAPSTGTEIELAVPAASAYVAEPGDAAFGAARERSPAS